MRFEFRLHDSLPRLAWCAHVKRGRDIVTVHHGPWVETRPDWFIEGAWTGPFESGAFADAVHMVGTGGRVERDAVLFCSPTNTCDRVHSIRVDDELYLSNSSPFLLEITGDRPDPRYFDYALDRFRQQAMGLREPDKQIPTARGRRLAFHDFCTIAIDRNLSIRRVEKSSPPPPVDYDGVVTELGTTIAAVLANAADPARARRRYSPLASISRGYDSPALAVLMRRADATDAFTFAPPDDDDGTPIGERLGFAMTRYDVTAFRTLPRMPEAEFHATPCGEDVTIAVCEPQLPGTLFVSGRRGDGLFNMERPSTPDLFNSTMGAMAGSTMGEFRLRVGFLHMLPYVHLIRHGAALLRISASPEMKRWSIGGPYDRPILRRIVEEAGIPRDLFGVRKRATASLRLMGPGDMSRESSADYRAFLRTMPTLPWERRYRHHRRRLLDALQRLPFASQLSDVQQVNARLQRFPPAMTFAFHWGCARTQSRYALEPHKADTISSTTAAGGLIV